ncbi:hypothetical protein HYR99_33295, partial [Candidatus Poribacteria bacterium]|nr:hypothetical protein [Candidatus Poribacteria bacterium]
MQRKRLLKRLSLFIALFLVGYTAYAQDLVSIDIGDAKNTPGSTQIK